MNDMSVISGGRVTSMHRLLEDPAVFIEMLPLAVCICDDVGRILVFNRRAAVLWGSTPCRDESCESFFGALHARSVLGTPFASVARMIDQALKSGAPSEGCEILIVRPSQPAARALLHVQPVKDESGEVIGAVISFRDVTAQHNDRHWANERHRAMVDELNHRVKNTLATVQSLAVQTLRAPQVPKDVRGLFESRLFALSRTHDHLMQAHWTSVDLKAVAEEIFMPYRYLGHDRIRFDGAPVAIAAHAAITLGMILHELVSNATKHGALAGPGGHVDIVWAVALRADSERDGGTRLIISWQEEGGPPVQESRRRGFGRRLLENGVAQGLKGVAQLTFDPGGLRCVIDVPLALIQEPRAEEKI